MFICASCLEKDFENAWWGMMYSKGPCEMCKYIKVCKDIKSTDLIKENIDKMI